MGCVQPIARSGHPMCGVEIPLCHGVDGVVSVHEHIAYRADDTQDSSGAM
ncbi:hypothetical protein [Embleya sp. NPDC020630]